MTIIELILLGISLSIDAFTLSLSIGTYNVSKKRMLLFAIIIGLFHLFMPIIGINISLRLPFKYHYLVNLVFLLIIIEMIINLKDSTIYYNLSISKMFLYAFSVSVDSLMMGLLLDSYIGPIIFMIISFLFTILGLYLGKYSYQRLGNIAKHLALIIMIFFMLFHFFY